MIGWRLLVVLACGLVVLLGPSPAAAEAFYKWVDDEGVTHYSSTRPKGRQGVERIVIEAQPPSTPTTRPVATPATASKPATELTIKPDQSQPQLIEASRASAAGLDAAATRPPPATPTAPVADSCEASRARLDELQNAESVVIDDPERAGQTRELTYPERRAAVIAQVAAVTAACR